MDDLKAVSIVNGGLFPALARKDGAVLFNGDAIALKFEMLEQVGYNGLGSKRYLACLSVQGDLKWHTSKLSGTSSVRASVGN